MFLYVYSSLDAVGGLHKLCCALVLAVAVVAVAWMTVRFLFVPLSLPR